LWEVGVQVLTLYAFSTENWTRPKIEVEALMQLLASMLRREVSELDKKGVQLRTIGQTDQLPPRVRDELTRATAKLKHNKGLVLNLALNYGGRQEIVDAVNRILKAGVKRVDDKIFSRFLDTLDLPDPDMVIRTSGEQRISNFLLFQAAYAEFYSTKVFWPDFRRQDLYEAILDYQHRERRFGATSEQMSKSHGMAAVV